jgi:hypothetical protein
MVDGGWNSNKVQAQYGDWIVTLDTYTQSSGKSSTTYTRIRAPFLNQDGFRFTVYRAGFFTGLGKLLGVQDIEIGEPLFDEQFVLQGNYEPRVQALFANSRIRELLLAQPAVYLAVKDDEGSWFAPSYPQGVDVLYFQVVGVIKDVAVLKGLFELYAEVLNHLCHLDSAYQDDEAIHLQARRDAALRTPAAAPVPEQVAAHLRALQAAGGQIEAEGIVLWDGDPARRAAARALGELKAAAAVPHLAAVLDARDPQLRATAAWSLGEIGDPGAVRPLIPLLGDVTQAGARPLQQHAAEALGKLGWGALAEAFQEAIQGRREAVETLRRHHCPELTAALLRVLEPPAVIQGVHAAWALGELGEVSALRQVRARAKELRRMVSPEHQALLTEAVGKLEVHSALPRPAAEPSPDISALPRPAGAE